MEAEGPLTCLHELALVRILSHMNRIHSLEPYFPNIYFNKFRPGMVQY
jgi:hypothetical protein